MRHHLKKNPKQVGSIRGLFGSNYLLKFVRNVFVVTLVIFPYAVGVYSAVPPPCSAQKPTASAAKKTQDSESSDSSDEEDKKAPGKRSHRSKCHIFNTFEC